MKGRDDFPMSPELIKSVIEGMGDGISIQDTNFKVLYQNGIHKGFIGEHIGEYCYKAYEKRENICDGCPVAMSFEDNQVHTAERVVTVNGEPKHFEITSSILKDPDGNVIGAIENVRDVTKRKKAEEYLQFTQLATDHASDAIFRMGSDARFIYVNEAACRCLGYSRDELLALSVFDISPDWPTEAWPDHWRKLKEQGLLTFETLHKRKDGSVFPVEINANFLTVSGQEFNCAIVRDITERKRADEAMIENEERFRNLFDNISSGVAIYDIREEGQEFVLIDMNKAGMRITNTPREQIIGRKVHEVFKGVREMGLLEVFKRVYQTGNPEHYPTHMYHDEKLAFWADNFVYKLPNGEIVAIFDDVTSVKQAEDELKVRTEELERINKAFVGRELKMIELKKEIEELKTRVRS